MSESEPKTYNDRYEVERRIARGGMADVFLARDLLLTRPVAVKVLFPEFASDPSFVARFRREAQAAANLNHPNIVGVYDWGQEDGTYYIVMEYVDGRSLSEILRGQGTPPAKTAAGIAADVAAALGFAHSRGVVHRDVKPGNIMITSDGHVKVADFGIARAITASAEENLTQAGSVMGTATYFSPEQAQGHNVEGRSDLYSLGVVMYEMAHGKPPFVAETPLAVAYKHVQEAPIPLSAVQPSVPAGYEAITMRLLSKSPDDRYPDAEALRSDLRRFSEGRPVRAAADIAAPTGATDVVDEPATRAVPVQPTPASPVPEPVPSRPVYEAQRARTGWFLLALLVIFAILGGGLWVLGSLLGVGGANKADVPSVVGLTFTEAELKLKQAGFVVIAERESSETVAENTVIRQTPEGESKAESGSGVTVIVSSGKAPEELLTVPDLVGMSYDDAVNRLEGEGFTGDIKRKERDSDEDEDEVITQTPISTSQVEADRDFTLTVSSGTPETVSVPRTSPRPATTAPRTTEETPRTTQAPTTAAPTTAAPTTAPVVTTTAP